MAFGGTSDVQRSSPTSVRQVRISAFGGWAAKMMRKPEKQHLSMGHVDKTASDTQT